MAGKKQNKGVAGKMHLEDVSLGVKAPEQDAKRTITMLDYEGQTVTTYRKQPKPKATD